MEFAIARMSTKGQVVIPSSMRTDLNPGDEMLFVRDEHRIIVKSVKSMANDLQKDVKFAERIEEVWRKHERGELKTATTKEFLKIVDKTLWPAGKPKTFRRKAKPLR